VGCVTQTLTLATTSVNQSPFIKRCANISKEELIATQPDFSTRQTKKNPAEAGFFLKRGLIT
jgi:hypothetical protein